MVVIDIDCSVILSRSSFNIHTLGVGGFVDGDCAVGGIGYFGGAGIICCSVDTAVISFDNHAFSAVIQLDIAGVCCCSRIDVHTCTYGLQMNVAGVRHCAAVISSHTETVQTVNGNRGIGTVSKGRFSCVYFRILAFSANSQHTIPAGSSGYFNGTVFGVLNRTAVNGNHSGMGIGNASRINGINGNLNISGILRGGVGVGSHSDKSAGTVHKRAAVCSVSTGSVNVKGNVNISAVGHIHISGPADEFFSVKKILFQISSHADQ